MRLGLAALCGYVLIEMIGHWEVILARPLAAIQGFVVPIAAMLWIFNYVVNIGFGVSWRRVPLVGLLALFLLLSALSRIFYGLWLAEPIGVAAAPIRTKSARREPLLAPTNRRPVRLTPVLGMVLGMAP